MAIKRYPARPYRLSPAYNDWGARVDVSEIAAELPEEPTLEDICAFLPGKLVEVTSRTTGKSWLTSVLEVDRMDGDRIIVRTLNTKRINKHIKGKYLCALKQTNPRKPGGRAWQSYQILLAHGGVVSGEEFAALGGHAPDIIWDAGRGNVEITDVAPVASLAVSDEDLAAQNAPQDFEDDGEILPIEFRRILDLGKIGQNILMIGPSGSGKTFLGAKLAEKLGRPFAAQSCSAGMSESQLAGWLLPVGDSGTFAYVPSAFVRMYEEGGVFLFDEVDAADENTLIFINAALANGSFYLPQRFENPRVERHPDFVAIAAANTYGLGESMIYSGRNQLDGATLDRFRAGVVMVEYSERVERSLVDPEVYAWGITVRKAILANSLERIMSTRVMLDFTRQKEELGYGQDQWEASYFADWSPDEKALVQ